MFAKTSFDYANCLSTQVTWEERGHNSPDTESLRRRRMTATGSEKSQCRKYSSIQHICFRKTSGSNTGRQTCFLVTRGAPKSPNNVTNTFFNTAHLLPRDLRFEHGGHPTCFLPRAPSSLVTPMCMTIIQVCKNNVFLKSNRN